MKHFLIIHALFNVCGLWAQTKGASPLAGTQQPIASKNTYAVVVGISDYQDKDIPDLRFADKDAEAFANYLRSDAGGKLDHDHLKVLINSNATMAQFANALDWLWESCREGDQAIIYFSGHGDVEKKSLTQPGFLLCWDAPARVYMAGGAFALPMLQEVVSTLSVQNKAKVIVITDACRSGTLAGSSVGGAQATASSLAKQFGNEIKIMSCQPNEYSIEGEQWGGGRGAFSFHLLEALYGMADHNNDLWVTLQEVGRYLEDHVSSEVAPVSQVPMIVGNRNERLSGVDEHLLAAIKSGKTSQTAMLSAVETRGIEEDVLSKLDTSIKMIYQHFKTSLKRRNFLEPVGSCAESYYQQLMQEPKLERLHATMKRNYAAALQDDAQQVLNQWLKINQDVSLGGSVKSRMLLRDFTEQVRTYPRCLDRAAELLGEKHYMHAALKARRFFFEGYLLANSNRNYNPELGAKALSLFRKSLEWQTGQPHVYWQMSMVCGYNFHQPDSLVHYARLAIDLYPNWIKVYTEAAFILSFKLKRQEMARLFLEQASRIDSNAVQVLHIGAVFNFGEKKYVEAELQLKKAIALDSTNYIIFNNLGYLYNETRRYAEAEPLFKKAIALDSTSALAWNNLAFTYGQMRRNAEAEPLFKKAISLDSANASIWNQLGYFYLINRRFNEAEPALKNAVALDSASTSIWNNLGGVYLQTRRFTDAEPVLKKALLLDSTIAPVWSNLGWVYLMTRRYAEAEPALEKAISLNANYANPRRHLGVVCFKTNRPEEARQHLLKALEINPSYYPAMLGMAYLLNSEGKTSEAIGYLEQAITKGSPFEQLEKDEDLDPLRSLPEWNALMGKHFPDQLKK